MDKCGSDGSSRESKVNPKCCKQECVTMARTMTKKQRVLNYLSSGRNLTGSQMTRKFGVANPRATISDIREQVERYGNWAVINNGSYGGETQYALKRVVLTDPRLDANDLAELF